MSWIQTYNGKKFHIYDFTVDDINIEDIAHSLSMQCRYNGHCKDFYSVAEHSVLVSRHCKYYNLEGLLHDAAEAYLADIPAPIKPHLRNYSLFEMSINQVLAEKFGLVYNVSFPVHVCDIDIALLKNEKEVLMNHRVNLDWGIEFPFDLNANIRCLSPKEAKQEFLDEFNKLMVARNETR